MSDGLETTPLPPERSASMGASQAASEVGIPDLAQPTRLRVSRKALVAVGLLVVSLIAVSAASIERLVGGKKADADIKRVGDKPAAASVEPKRLDLAVAAPRSAASAGTPTPKIPAIVPADDELAEPIGLRKTSPPGNTAAKPALPEDAPVVLVSSRTATASGASATRRNPSEPSDPTGDTPLDQTRRNLEAYQRQLQGLLESMSRGAQPLVGTAGMPGVGPGATGGIGSGAVSGSNAVPAQSGLFGDQLQGSATPRAHAASLSNRSLVMPKGTAFTCALKTRVISATSGLIGCQVQRNVFGDDGRVLLIERGSHVDGEYRIASIRPGIVRIPVLWTRIRTPNGVVVDLDSPGTGALGESGIDGYLDNRWAERVGAAVLLSVIDDAVKLVIQHQTEDTNATSTVVLPATTGSTSKLAEKVLDSTINIPPLIYRNQGGIVGIYVARDVDFSSVYGLDSSPQ